MKDLPEGFPTPLSRTEDEGIETTVFANASAPSYKEYMRFFRPKKPALVSTGRSLGFFTDGKLPGHF